MNQKHCELSYRVVQNGTLFVTETEGMVDNRPTSSLLKFAGRNLFSLERLNVLIDIDHPKKDPEDIKSSLKEAGILPEDVDIVILTHLHPDHIGHKDIFCNARFVFHRDERLAFYFKENKTIRLDGSVLWRITDNKWPVPVDSIPDLKSLGNDLFICHCPGHTKGSIVIFALIDNLVHAFAGGVFLNREYFENWQPSAMSWEQNRIYEHMSLIRDNADVVIPGHGKPFRIRKC